MNPHSDTSEIMQESLRLLEEKEASSKLESLRNALIEGEESGTAGKLDMDDIKRQARQKGQLADAITPERREAMTQIFDTHQKTFEKLAL